MDNDADIFAYIQTQEAAYKRRIRVAEGWEWNMHSHIQKAILYKNSQFIEGNSDTERQFKPFKNIIRPILNLQYRAEGFDVKDIVLYVDNAGKYHLSFLAKKYHEKYARDNGLDTFIDEMVESYIDFGGVLVKNVNDVRPEVVPLQSIAFCDQTDVLSGPIGIKHYFSPDQLLEMASKGWGDKKNGATASLEETIILSRKEKKQDPNGVLTQTPGKYIEVYEVHGNLPLKFLKGDQNSLKYVNQMQIVCFYEKNGSEKGKIVLYKAEESKSPFKFKKRDPIYGRALGFGGVEELEDPQVWTNYNEIRKQQMLDASSKTVIVTSDSALASRHPSGLKDVDNMEIIEEAPQSNTRQLDTFPRNIKLFEESNMQWEGQAQKMGSANDSIMGESPTAGTPFKLQELVTQESHSLHEYRKGQLATFLDEIYRDWIIPRISRDVVKGAEFLSELDLEELQYVGDCVVRTAENDMIKEKILNGELIDPEEVEGYKEIVKDEFKRKGNKHFLKLLKGEMKDAPMSVKTNIVGKQKNLAATVDKIGNVIRTVLQAGGPTALSFPATWDVINQMIEKSGLDPVDFSGLAEAFKKLQQQQAQMQAQPVPAQPAMV